MNIETIKEMNIAEIIVRHGTDPLQKNKPFLLFRDDQNVIQSISYDEYYKKSLAYGNVIQQMRIEQGSKPQDRFHVGVFMQNVPEFFYIFGACALTGTTLVGINNAQIGVKLAFDINTIDIKVLFVDTVSQAGLGPSFLETVADVKKTIGFTNLKSQYIIPIGKHGSIESLVTKDITQKLMDYNSSLHRFVPVPLVSTHTGVIIFTSGTTGIPKGIEVSWKKLVDVGITATAILGYSFKDVGYVCMPINHSNSLYLNCMPALLHGAKIFLRRRFSVSNFIKDIEDVGATVWNCVGDPVQYLLNYIRQHHGDTADFSHLPLRTVISTGTNAVNRAAFTKIFGLEIFKEVYGSTESGAITAVDVDTPPYSVGKLLKDIRIMHEETLCECPEAELNEKLKITNLDVSAGEILVSQKSLGGSAFSGYYKLPEESKKRLYTFEKESFYRMGDLGAITHLNTGKYLIFLGRTGDWIRYKGENWAPLDGEKIIARYGSISNVGIIGVPQSIGREDDPMYVIEVESPQEFDCDLFYSFCKNNLPRYMLPRFIRVVAHLPMTETMKLKKAQLKNDFYFRSPRIDEDKNDCLYEMIQGKTVVFNTIDYQHEIAKFTDSTNQDTLKTFTKRSDLFLS